MIPRLVADIQKAIDNSCYFSALALALTLPDICGKAAYPNESRGSKRYIDWYEEVVGITEKPPDEDDEMPYLSVSVVYQLRCAFLHQGTPNPNIAKNKIREECCRTNEFSLILSKDNFSDCSSVSKNFFQAEQIGDAIRTYEVDVRRLCFILSACANGYYKENKEKFNFFNCTIVEPDEQS